ncbi:MAG: hypothetical protein ACPGSD_10390 [Flavobacteriales bacterium]
MSKSKYELESLELIKIIDIAIKSFNKHPPINWPHEQTVDFIKLYAEEKKSILKPKFKNVNSIRQSKNNILIYFQESNGKTVNYFWEEIAANQISLERKNIIKKVLKRKKILNIQEYDHVIDLMVPYFQSKMITERDFENLKTYIGKFELQQ